MHISRKRRTREHVIADLSVNYVERLVLRCGWTVQRLNPDYGLDLFMRTFDANGEVENGEVWLQVKATDSLKFTQKGTAIPIPLEWRDLLYWLNERFPVVLIVYDAVEECAYLLDLQASLRRIRPRGASVTVHLPRTNELDETAIRHFATLRDGVLRRQGP